MKPIISADSHITEPPGTYVDRIDKSFRDRAPHVVRDAKRGDLFVIDGLDKPIPMGLVAAAGKSAEDLKMFGARFEDMHRGGWDPQARLADFGTLAALGCVPGRGVAVAARRPDRTVTKRGRLWNRERWERAGCASRGSVWAP